MEWQESRSGKTRRSWDHRTPSRGSLMVLPAGKGMQTTPAMIGNTPIHVSIMSIDAFGREATPRKKAKRWWVRSPHHTTTSQLRGLPCGRAHATDTRPTQTRDRVGNVQSRPVRRPAIREISHPTAADHRQADNVQKVRRQSKRRGWDRQTSTTGKQT